MSKIYLLEPEVTREGFDKVFDAHWHNGFMIRHLIYKLSRGDSTEAPMQGSPLKTKALRNVRVSINNAATKAVPSQARSVSGLSGFGSRSSLVTRLH